MTDTSNKKFFFDYEKLAKLFVEICPDFSAEPHYENATTSRRFAEKVIFDYSKKAKTSKAQNKDKVWSLILETTNSKGKPLKNKLIISTYAFKPAPLQQPFLQHGHLHLTFKQASLLAVAKYCQLVPHLIQRNHIVLTPLAGAIFNKSDMPKLAEELNEPLVDVVMAVISSCQTDGYYLKHSRCHIALAALNKTIVDLKLRGALITKTINMYRFHGKELDKEQLKIFSKYSQQVRQCPTDNSKMEELVAEVIALGN
ncbi:uncharacterized protein LOC115623187 [Scaptodrosophila lebanonensis]|uniref:Uncharacterized protein LOC115623187 n=1 Tax=Drosophila lebanonensis TaxID=7225 RepID=A0A6J2TD05_DROLE|nr:uncharacterized protein LOC115623187 [Scaptodrosophila lebanonensis]